MNPEQETDPVAVATGDRRDEVHFEQDGRQGVEAVHLVRPAGALPRQGDNPSADEIDPDAPPIEDVKVAPDAPSVWDARPVDR
jgi:hypothetical protein